MGEAIVGSVHHGLAASRNGAVAVGSLGMGRGYRWKRDDVHRNICAQQFGMRVVVWRDDASCLWMKTGGKFCRFANLQQHSRYPPLKPRHPIV